MWIVNHRYEIAIKNLYVKSIEKVCEVIDRSMECLGKEDITFEKINKYQHDVDFMPYRKDNLLIDVLFKLEKEELVAEPSMAECRDLFVWKKNKVFTVATEIPCI